MSPAVQNHPAMCFRKNFSGAGKFFFIHVRANWKKNFADTEKFFLHTWGEGCPPDTLHNCALWKQPVHHAISLQSPTRLASRGYHATSQATFHRIPPWHEQVADVHSRWSVSEWRAALSNQWAREEHRGTTPATRWPPHPCCSLCGPQAAALRRRCLHSGVPQRSGEKSFLTSQIFLQASQHQDRHGFLGRCDRRTATYKSQCGKEPLAQLAEAIAEASWQLDHCPCTPSFSMGTLHWRPWTEEGDPVGVCRALFLACEDHRQCFDWYSANGLWNQKCIRKGFDAWWSGRGGEGVETTVAQLLPESQCGSWSLVWQPSCGARQHISRTVHGGIWAGEGQETVFEIFHGGRLPGRILGPSGRLGWARGDPYALPNSQGAQCGFCPKKNFLAPEKFFPTSGHLVQNKLFGSGKVFFIQSPMSAARQPTFW